MNRTVGFKPYVCPMLGEGNAWLPRELHRMILSWCDGATIARAGRVCEGWASLVYPMHGDGEIYEDPILFREIAQAKIRHCLNSQDYMRVRHYWKEVIRNLNPIPENLVGMRNDFMLRVFGTYGATVYREFAVARGTALAGLLVGDDLNDAQVALLENDVQVTIGVINANPFHDPTMPMVAYVTYEICNGLAGLNETAGINLCRAMRRLLVLHYPSFIKAIEYEYECFVEMLSNLCVNGSSEPLRYEALLTLFYIATEYALPFQCQVHARLAGFRNLSEVVVPATLAGHILPKLGDGNTEDLRFEANQRFEAITEMRFPRDILLHILSFVDPFQVMTVLRLVCRRWCLLADSKAYFMGPLLSHGRELLLQNDHEDALAIFSETARQFPQSVMQFQEEREHCRSVICLNRLIARNVFGFQTECSAQLLALFTEDEVSDEFMDYLGHHFHDMMLMLLNEGDELSDDVVLLFINAYRLAYQRVGEPMKMPLAKSMSMFLVRENERFAQVLNTRPGVFLAILSDCMRSGGRALMLESLSALLFAYCNPKLDNLISLSAWMRFKYSDGSLGDAINDFNSYAEDERHRLGPMFYDVLKTVASEEDIRNHWNDIRWVAVFDDEEEYSSYSGSEADYLEYL